MRGDRSSPRSTGLSSGTTAVAGMAQIFLSYASEDGFEASLLQARLEHVLQDLGVSVWTYERNQNGDERSIAEALRDRIRSSSATIMLVSPFTLNGGATQWMELAYADAYDVPTFVLLHHLAYDELKQSHHGVPPLLMQGQCTAAKNWRTIEEDLRRVCNYVSLVARVADERIENE